MDTSVDSATLSDDSSATQADISGVDSPTHASNAASAAAGSNPDTSIEAATLVCSRCRRRRPGARGGACSTNASRNPGARLRRRATLC